MIVGVVRGCRGRRTPIPAAADRFTEVRQHVVPIGAITVDVAVVRREAMRVSQALTIDTPSSWTAYRAWVAPRFIADGCQMVEESDGSVRFERSLPGDRLVVRLSAQGGPPQTRIQVTTTMTPD